MAGPLNAKPAAPPVQAELVDAINTPGGRSNGQDTVAVTTNEVRHGFNQKVKRVLAAVADSDSAESVHYVQCH